LRSFALQLVLEISLLCSQLFAKTLMLRGKLCMQPLPFLLPLCRLARLFLVLLVLGLVRSQQQRSWPPSSWLGLRCCCRLGCLLLLRSFALQLVLEISLLCSQLFAKTLMLRGKLCMQPLPFLLPLCRLARLFLVLLVLGLVGSQQHRSWPGGCLRCSSCLSCLGLGLGCCFLGLLLQLIAEALLLRCKLLTEVRPLLLQLVAEVCLLLLALPSLALPFAGAMPRLWLGWLLGRSRILMSLMGRVCSRSSQEHSARVA